MSEFLRHFIDLAWLKGPIHEPKESGDYSNLRDGMAENTASIREDTQEAAFVRTPSKTADLEALEREYGLSGNSNLTTAKRIQLLEVARYRRATTAPDDDLQTLLDRAGFDLIVYNNSPDGPAIDPAIILDQNFVVQCGDQTNDYMGQDLAYMGRIGGFLLVNGPIYTQVPAYYGCGDLYCGNDIAVCGYFERLTRVPIEYDIPADPDAWPFVFFVGGDATFNVDGSISFIEQGYVPSEQRKKLEDIILQFKPMFTWCGLVVTFT